MVDVFDYARREVRLSGLECVRDSAAGTSMIHLRTTVDRRLISRQRPKVIQWVGVIADVLSS